MRPPWWPSVLAFCVLGVGVGVLAGWWIGVELGDWDYAHQVADQAQWGLAEAPRHRGWWVSATVFLWCALGGAGAGLLRRGIGERLPAWVPPVAATLLFCITASLAAATVVWWAPAPQWAGLQAWWIVWPVALVAAIRARWYGVLGAVAGYVLGCALGDGIGNAVYAEQQARFAQEQLDPANVATWHPSHPGWWIFLVTFSVSVVLALVAARRARARGLRTTAAA